MTPVASPPDPNQVIRATVIVRSRCPDVEVRRDLDRYVRLHPLERPRLTPRQFTRRYGPLAADISRVAAHAHGHGLRVAEISSARHSVILSGTLARFARAFHVEFGSYDLDGTRFIGHRTPISVPAALAPAVVGVLGFDDRPLSRPDAAAAPSGGVSPDAVARAYGFPPVRSRRSGQTIAIMLPYGGVAESDLVRFFKRLGRRVPVIRELHIEGHTNEPAPAAALRRFTAALSRRRATPRLAANASARGRGSSPWNVLWSVEAALDIELAGALAPKADLLVCYMPDNPRGKFEGFARVLTHATRPSVISCSWSAHEQDVPPSLRSALDRLFMFAVLRNVTICCSSGDDGCAPGERTRVHFPASSPWVLACGGSTFADPAGPRYESVWDEQIGPRRMSTSGGFSRAFARPWWQRPHLRLHARPGRGVPDVAGKADFEHGFQMVVGGRDVALGGTSAATPLWAALIARLNDAVGVPLGFVSPLLYAARAKTALCPVTVGGNGTYRASRGWDPCTGLGTPAGAALLDVMSHPSPRGSRRRRGPRQSARA